jgi:imidazoleglycerol phosphate dehydratase HisB
MHGKAAIQQGVTFAFGMLKQPGFTIRHFWTMENTGAVEVDTHHVLENGAEVQFPQVFVFEIRDDLLSRFQSYAPYPPPQPS